MYLKKIVASGFKSFADKVTLTLAKENITGIVGPNGSGKSNVIDAVRWVMGEQNAKMLRGEKATDIIFAGSEKRKPLGMAEVSLVFDNAEASPFCPAEYRHEEEITLTRRLYVDGQREYLINRKPCRLKDLLSFFASTGLGGRSYSMIQQGQVDRILQAKPEEIREILEEAAGVSIFKQRRSETQRKLEKTQDNLARLDDILGEVSKQMEALQEQVTKAEKWQTLADRLRADELDLFAHNYVHFSKKSLELHKGIEDEALKEVASIGEIATSEARQHELKQTLDAADPELHALNEEITVVRERIASSEAALASCQQLMDHGNEQLAGLDRDVEEEQQNLQNSERLYEEASLRLHQVQQDALELEEVLETLNQQYELCEEEAHVYQNKREDLSEEKRKLDSLLDNNRMRRESCEKEYSHASRSMAEHSEQVLSLEAAGSQAQILAEGISIKLKNCRKGLDHHIESKQSYEQQLRVCQDKMPARQEEQDRIKGQYFEEKARLLSLSELEKHAGDAAAKIRQLRSEQASYADLLPLLSDFIAFAPSVTVLPEAVRGAFEHWAERLLLREPQNLARLEELLAAQRLGRVAATLVPSPTPARLKEASELKAWAQAKGLQPFAEHLRMAAPDEWSEALTALLARVYYVPQTTFEARGADLGSQAQQHSALLADCPPAAVLIFAQGLTYFSSEQDWVLGQAQQEGSLARKASMEVLEQKVAKLQTRRDAIVAEIAALDARSRSIQSQLGASDQAIMAQNQELLEIMANLKAAEHKAQHQEHLAVTAREAYAKLSSGCERLGAELDDLRQNDTRLRQEKTQVSLALEDAKSEAEELHERRRELQRQCDQKRVAAASAQAMRQTLLEHFDRDKVQRESLQQKVARRREERNILAGKIEASRTRYSELMEDIAEFIYRREELEDALAIKKQNNAGILEELRAVEARLKEARLIQAKAQKNLSDRELELERVRLGVEGVRQQALEKYHLDITTWEFSERPDFEPASQARRVGALRAQLDSLGPVNMMAIEEYRALDARQSFMEAQKNEVLNAIALLGLAISEIEETSKIKFLETFRTLNIEFAELFPILFPRGEGQIQLSDEENPLEAGVEIMVRLPGKARQNMRAFSGGEKALTAIALIFALLKSKPTPFCFLDEVDAPLDETNVSRYSKVLEALSDRFQFIVITHRRGTMEALDTLYGVTMQEPGVSKVVGVDMAKALPSHLQKAFQPEASERQGASAGP